MVTRKWFTLATLVVLLAVAGLPAAAPAEAVSPNVVISQVYGGGGNSGATYTHDFVELFNRGTSPVSLVGWSVQYASSTGNTWLVTSLVGSIAPGQYYLIQQAQGSGGTTPLPTPDATGTVAMSATNGKVALANSTTALSGTCPAGGTIVDFVGFGSANCSEGAPTPALSNTTAALRNSNGCVDTDNNAADFTTGAPAPRNTASPFASCAGPTPPTGSGSANPAAVDAGSTSLLTVAVTPGANPPSTGLAVSADLTAIGGANPQPFYDDGTNGDATAGDLVFSYLATVDQSTTLGAKTLPATVTDAEARSSGATIALTVQPPLVKIHDVQGSGPDVVITTLAKVEAVVVADYQSGDQLRGFFIQEEDADADADPATSEGIFVFCGSCATGVAVGDKVQVTGQPVDFFAMSQIDVTKAGGAVALVSTGNPLPTPATLDLPAPGSTKAPATFENVEGMLVTFADTMVVSEYFELARYGQLVLTADARPPQFTDAFEPSVPGYAAFLADLNSRRIILDDDNNIQNDALGSTPAGDEPYFWPRAGLSITNRVRGGDSISNLTGVLHWSFAGQGGTDAWRVRPVEEAFPYPFTANNSRPPAPDPVGGSFRVAGFNVLNYFTTINSRGADSTAELNRQREKSAAAICELNADILGLTEIENNGPVAISDLLNGPNGVNAKCGPYSFVDTGVIGPDQIAVAFLYRPATVNPVGSFAILTSAVDPRFLETRNRPALAQTFEEIATGARLTVVVNHLKSKGSACTSDGDPDLLDGQGNCNVVRRQAAAAMVDWLATDPTSSGDPDFLIIGDLNAYRNEDPIDTIEAGSDDLLGTADDYTDLLDALLGPSAYSYVFDGQLGYLDHALANTPLRAQVTGVTAWHINADEIPVFDYNDDILDVGNESSFERESTSLPIYESNASRASDHDPILVGLDLNGPPVCSAAYASPDTLWPVNHHMVEVQIMGVTDPDGDATITVDAIYQDEPVNGTGDGDTAPDGEGVGTSTALLRAERDGGGNGRVYHVFFTATDTAGNTCSGVVKVGVPKSQGKNGAAVDDGPLFDSTIIPQ